MAAPPPDDNAGPLWRRPAFLNAVRERVEPAQFERFTKMLHEPFYLTGVRLQFTATAGTSVTFSVSGSTRQIYEVRAGSTGALSCSCKDALMTCRRRGMVCKHVCFVAFRVLQLDDFDFETRRLTDAQLAVAATGALTGFRRRPEDARNMTRMEVASLCASLGALATAEVPTKDRPRFDVVTREAEECPVCYDSLAVQSSHGAGVLGCPDCGNGIHTRCMDRWLSTMTRASCVWCRSRVWKDYTPSGADLA